MDSPKELALVYPVAGMSSRFGGRVKQFAHVGPRGETLIEYSLGQALPAGFTKIIFIVGEKTEKSFKEKFGDSYRGLPVYYALQSYDPEVRDKPWGTVDALLAAQHLIDCPFVFCNGDDLYGEESFKMLVEHLLKEGRSASIGFRLADVLPEDGSTTRGIFCVAGDAVVNIVETFHVRKIALAEVGLKADDLCSMNIFGFHPEILEILKTRFEDFKEKHRGDRKAECILPVEIGALLNHGVITMKLYPAKDRWFGVTNPDDELVVREQLKFFYGV